MEVISHELRTRVGETEYVEIDPAFVVASPFGDFYSHPDFPDRYDANQLCRVRLDAGHTDELLRALERLYEPTGLSYRKVSGYDPDVWSHLAPTLSDAGWGVWTTHLMLHRADSLRPPNGDVIVSAVPSTSPDLELLHQTEGSVDRGFELARRQSARMGGEHLVGYLAGKPVGRTGWFERNGVVRFRNVFTQPSARGRGVATTLIHHVQHHAAVQAADELAIMVNEDGPRRLYEELGFRRVMTFWEAKLGA